MSLFRTAARASVATRVIGNTHRRQQQRWAAQGTTSSTAPVSPVPTTSASAEAPVQPAKTSLSSTTLDDLTRLGHLRDSGVLTDAEFDAEKGRLLARP